MDGRGLWVSTAASHQGAMKLCISFSNTALSALGPVPAVLGLRRGSPWTRGQFIDSLVYLWVETTDCELLRQIIKLSFICWSKKCRTTSHHCVCAARSREYSNRLLLWRQHRKRQCVSLCLTSEQSYHSVCVGSVSASHPTPATHELPGVGE